MNIKKEIILIGGGGHCKSCIDVIEQEGTSIAGIVEISIKENQKILGYKIIGVDEDLPDLVAEYSCLVTIGQIKTVAPRLRLYKKLHELNAHMPVIISPRAYVSPHAEIGEGTIIMHGAIVNAGTRIGVNCIINSNVLLEHDAMVEDHCHISTGAIINGGARIKNQSFVGSRVVIREYRTVGCQSIIGSGGVIMDNLPDKSIIKTIAHA